MPDLLVKVCGLTRAEDVTLCASLGVDFMGFIFHPKSPRHVDPDSVRDLAGPGPKRVGVFVDQTPGEVRGIMDRAGLDLAQLHGNQDQAFCRAVGPDRVVKVLWPERHPDRAGLEEELERFAPVCRLFILDAGTSGGGHGRSLDFQGLSGLKSPRPWLLAGGLGPDNLALALETCRPCGVDLNSGVEARPGVKDPDKVRLALSQIRQHKDDPR